MSRLFFLCAFLIPLLLFSQDYGYFKGTVKDKSNGEFLVGANLTSKQDPSLGAATNVNGSFSLYLQPGQYIFTISFTGMKSDTVNIRISPNETVTREIMIEPYINELQGIEIRAGKFDKKIEDMTVSMEIIKPGLIEAKNTQNVQTILDYTPGLNILDNEPQIRGGSGFTFGVGSKVAVLVDDMPMLSGEAGRPYWDLIPVENIEQIEVIKGASSVLSGTSSLSGAIHIRTASPGLKPLTKITAFSGLYTSPPDPSQKWWDDYPYIMGANFLHTRKIDNTDLTIGGNLNFDHGYIGAPRPGPYVVDTTSDFSDKQMATQKVRINFNFRQRSEKIQGLNYGVNGNFMYEHAPMILVWLDDTSGFFRAYPGAVFLQDMYIGYLDPFLNYYSRVGYKHSLKARVMYTNNQQTNNQSSRTTFIFADYNFRRDYDFLQGLQFIGGISTQYSTTWAQLYTGLDRERNNMLNMSGYVQFENNLFSFLNLSIGGRVEYYNMNGEETDIKPIFRAGLNLKLLKETFIRMSYGQGYRFPTIAERYISTNLGTFGVYANPNLKSESSWNAEIGVKQGFKFLNYFGYIDVAVFQQEYRNTVEYLFGKWGESSPAITGYGFKFCNTGHSRITGIDISVTGMAKLGEKTTLKTMIGYNYIMPKSLDPAYVYASDTLWDVVADTVKKINYYSYNSTSVDSSQGILKYRFLHTLKGDIEFTCRSFSFGISIKYFSKIENLDASIFEFEKVTEQTGGSMQPIRYMDYFYNHNNGNWIFDFRAAYKITDHHQVSLIAKNLFNNIYSLRPLKSEPMRSIVLQYIFKM